MTEGQPGPAHGRDTHADELGVLLTRVARGDLAAYEAVYDRMCSELDVRAIAVPEDAWAQIDAVSDVPGAEHLAARSDIAIAGD